PDRVRNELRLQQHQHIPHQRQRSGDREGPGLPESSGGRLISSPLRRHQQRAERQLAHAGRSLPVSDLRERFEARRVRYAAGRFAQRDRYRRYPLQQPAGPGGTLMAPEVCAVPLSEGKLQRSMGSCRIVVRGAGHRNQIVDLFQRSPVRVMFPHLGRAGIEEAVLVNTSGGVAGGDQLHSSVSALARSSITVTSQTAERIYRALDEPAHIMTRLIVSSTARLAWCPQETIVFDRARVRRETRISLSSGAEALALEWIVLGRTAHGEAVAGGHISDSWRVERDGRLVWADTLRITDDVFPHLRRNALLADSTAVATLVYFGPDLENRLNRLRDWAASLECPAAATRVGGLVVLRFAATLASALGRGLRSVLQQFDRAFGPGPFRVPKMWSC